MIKPVLQKGSPILKTLCKEVTDFEAIQSLVQDLNDTIDHLKTTHVFERGIGLAAPQIGESVRVTVVMFADGRRYTLINPEIVETSNVKKRIKEGCISFLQFRALTPRFTFVKVKAYDLEGKIFFLGETGNAAMLIQHEIDHLNGILYIEHL